MAEGEQLWIEFLDRVELFDAVAFAYAQQSEAFRNTTTLAAFVQRFLSSGGRDTQPDIAGKLFAATVDHLRLHIQVALQRAFDAEDLRTIPHRGVLQYFGDDLSFCLYGGYRSQGQGITFEEWLTVPDPVLLADPLRLVEIARSPEEQDLARRALYSSHKTILLRNTLVHVDREHRTHPRDEHGPSVFGPSIDTLLLSDWLLTNRFAEYRRDSELYGFFDDPLTPSASESIRSSGVSVLEPGPGSGMILATFAKNEPRLHRFEAIDASLVAVNATYNNTYRQRQLHGGWIGDQGTYIVGRFDKSRVGSDTYDVVVCNPPYVPKPPGGILPRDEHSDATMGTELLEGVLSCIDQLISDGVMYLVVSNLTSTVLRGLIPTNFDARVVARRNVPFVVSSARAQDGSDSLAYLKSLGLKSKTKFGAQKYYHEVQIYEIRRAIDGG